VTRSLLVWWDGAVVGALQIDRHGDLSFAYDPTWLADPRRPAISRSLPKQLEPFNRRKSRPFFAGLLPEAAQREAVAQALGVSEGNDFRLLEALGGDVAGALTLWPQDEQPPKSEGIAAARPLGKAELIEILDSLPKRPLLAGREGLRLSLAGVQQKLPVVLVNGLVALPAPGQPTTHILKPPIERFAATTENETFAMRLAADIGLPVARVDPRHIDGRSFLIIERYDREIRPEGDVRRLHQEDFCQALGVPPEHKYASEGGPGFRDCFDLLRRACTRPAPAVLQLMDAAIFNVVVGNADAHGKNFSLLYANGSVALAPLYDLLCTTAYPELSPTFAMRIAKRATIDDFRPDTWELFAKDVGVGAPYVRRRVRALAAAMLERAPRLAVELSQPGFDSAALERYSAAVADRAARVLARN
jgi:serine/threonine-protein kinase HipA